MSIVSDFFDTKVGGFVGGVLIIAGGVIIVRFGGGAIASLIARKGSMIVAKKVSEFVVQDLYLGRVPFLDLTRPITVGSILLTTFTVGWWMMGGTDAAKDALKYQFGLDPKIVGDWVYDELPVTYIDGDVWVLRSKAGSLNAVIVNATRIDP